MQNFINYGKFMHYHIHIEKNSGENNTVVTSMGSNNWMNHYGLQLYIHNSKTDPIASSVKQKKKSVHQESWVDLWHQLSRHAYNEPKAYQVLLYIRQSYNIPGSFLTQAASSSTVMFDQISTTGRIDLADRAYVMGWIYCSNAVTAQCSHKCTETAVCMLSCCSLWCLLFHLLSKTISFLYKLSAAQSCMLCRLLYFS